MAQKHSVRLLAEMSEFGTFSAAEQRYIRRSLDVGFNRLDAVESFVGPLIALAAYDLSEGKIASFAAFRFLYERLVGAMARPWLPSVFCAAAALPQLHPEQRKLLLQSVRGFDAAAHGWSILEPLFYPEWVEKVAEVVN